MKGYGDLVDNTFMAKSVSNSNSERIALFSTLLKLHEINSK